MNTETMTIHRALSELKTLDARILKTINSTEFCAANKHNNTKINGVSISDFSETIKNNFKSIKTLINRRNALKRAIALSNAETEVEIGGKKYKIAEAIEMKNHGIENFRHLLTSIRISRGNAQNVIDKYNGENLEKKANEYVIGLYGSKEKASSAEAEVTRKAYIEANSYDFIDPINTIKTEKELETIIDSFTAEVDAALSTSNAITVITFSYEVE